MRKRKFPISSTIKQLLTVPNYDSKDKILVKVKKWIEVFYKKISNDADGGGSKLKAIYDSCKETVEGVENIGDHEPFCKFIVRIAWNIYLEHRNLRSRNSEELKDYVHCTILNLFLYYYIKGKCMHDGIINYLFKAMIRVDDAFKDEYDRGDCMYGSSTHRSTNVDSIVDGIYNLVSKNSDIKKKLSEISPKLSCDVEEGEREGKNIGRGHFGDKGEFNRKVQVHMKEFEYVESGVPELKKSIEEKIKKEQEKVTPKQPSSDKPATAISASTANTVPHVSSAPIVQGHSAGEQGSAGTPAESKKTKLQHKNGKDTELAQATPASKSDSEPAKSVVTEPANTKPVENSAGTTTEVKGNLGNGNGKGEHGRDGKKAEGSQNQGKKAEGAQNTQDKKAEGVANQGRKLGPDDSQGRLSEAGQKVPQDTHVGGSTTQTGQRSPPAPEGGKDDGGHGKGPGAVSEPPTTQGSVQPNGEQVTSKGSEKGSQGVSAAPSSDVHQVSVGASPAAAAGPSAGPTDSRGKIDGESRSSGVQSSGTQGGGGGGAAAGDTKGDAPVSLTTREVGGGDQIVPRKSVDQSTAVHTQGTTSVVTSTTTTVTPSSSVSITTVTTSAPTSTGHRSSSTDSSPAQGDPQNPPTVPDVSAVQRTPAATDQTTTPVTTQGNQGQNSTKQMGPSKPGTLGVPAVTTTSFTPTVTVNSEDPGKIPKVSDTPLPPKEGGAPHFPLIPVIPVLIVTILLGFLLYKYFPLGGGRRRRRRAQPTSPSLEDNILQHIQHEELPTSDTSYGYTMTRTRPPRPMTKKRSRKRVNRRTIIEIHLEVVDECQHGTWALHKNDFLEILVQKFAQEFTQHGIMKDKEEFMQGEHTAGKNFSDHTTAGNSIGTNTGDVPRVDEIGKEEKGSILRGNHSNVYGGINRNEKDATNRKSNSINSVYWVHWIERNKGVLEECKDQPWFHMLKSGWKQQQQQEYSQIVELDQIEETEQGQAYHSEFHENNDVPFLERQKDSWRQWVAKQYTRMQMVSEQDWFRHLLNNIEEEEAEVVEEVLGVEQPPQEQQRPNELQQSNELEPHKSETEKAKENISWTKVEELEKEHLCREFGKKKQFIAKLWMLILALVIEECEMEDNLHDKELYVDSLLQKL